MYLINKAEEARDSEWAYETAVRLYSELDNQRFARGVLRFWCESQAYFLEDLVESGDLDKDGVEKDHSRDYRKDLVDAVFKVSRGDFEGARNKLAFLAAMLYNADFNNYDEWED